MNWRAAGKTSALLCLLFLAVYGGCNWLTTLRHGVGSFYFAWERHIPFVPAMILPYMSIDLFFIASPFLCAGARERYTLASRIAAAILISGACWLLFPLRFAFDRPHVGGWLGLIFNNFRSLDQPFNQFPSLHITLRAILVELYARKTRGILRLGLRVWFSLIGFSTVLTYQHHVIDVAGGFALAAWCFYLFQDQPLRLPVHPRDGGSGVSPPSGSTQSRDGSATLEPQPNFGCVLRPPVICNRRVGLYYAAGAMVLAGLGFVALPWSALLLWPAASLGLVAGAYFGLGPGIFRKSAGRLPLSTWCVHWPVLLGQRLSLVYYARGCRPWDALTPRVWIGRQLSDSEARQAVAAGVTAALDLTGEFSEARPLLAVAYHPLPVMDLTAPTPEQLQEAVEFIRRESRRGVVYVHCKVGYSRTAAVAGAYLLAERMAATAEEAVGVLQAARPGIVVRPEAMEALRAYEAGCRMRRDDAQHR
ncbi:MAG: phosphatase PAP2/dual specificity phosphatase family protein [Tepidisphaerales bacterium]